MAVPNMLRVVVIQMTDFKASFKAETEKWGCGDWAMSPPVVTLTCCGQTLYISPQEDLQWNERFLFAVQACHTGADSECGPSCAPAARAPQRWADPHCHGIMEWMLRRRNGPWRQNPRSCASSPHAESAPAINNARRGSWKRRTLH